MIFFIVTSLGEMSAYLPLPGAFTTSGARFVDPALGFGVGVFYAFQWIITVTIEVTAAGKILQYWWPHLPMWIPALIFIVNLVGITLLGVKAFGELEYWLSMIKVLTCFIFIIIGILVDTGAVGGDFIGGRNWHIEGAPIVGETAKEKTVNIFTTCVWAFFSFGGIELIGITAGESSNPAKAVPKAIRQTFWRILPFYILSITVIGLITLGRTPLCSAPSLWKSTRPPRLLPSPRSSRWPILPGADQAINAVLLTAVLSAGQSFFYASTRTLMAMGREGKMPVIFGRVNGRGAPCTLWPLSPWLPRLPLCPIWSATPWHGCCLQVAGQPDRYVSSTHLDVHLGHPLALPCGVQGPGPLLVRAALRSASVPLLVLHLDCPGANDCIHAGLSVRDGCSF